MSVTYQALLKEESSTPTSMEALVISSRDNNSRLRVGGQICVIDPLSTSYLVEQTIEGDPMTIVELFLRIKADGRIEEVTKVNFSFVAARAYPKWGMTLHLGKSSSWARNFLREATKHKILHQCALKTSFLVEDVHTRKHYMLKEYTKSESSNNFLSRAIPYANEVRMLQFLNKERPSGVDDKRGICPVPDVFHELVRVSIIYPMFEMDLFSFLENYTAVHHCDSLQPELVKLYFMQMLVILKTLKGAGMIHRDIKPENFCIDEGGCLILIDYELALILNGENSDDDKHFCRNVIVGTPHYLAPETLTDLMYSYQSDLWAVACTVCDLCSPVTPFAFENDMKIDEIKSAVVGKKPSRPLGVPDDLWKLLEGILCDLEGRLTLEDVMQDEYFSSVRDSDPFDRSNPALDGARSINKQFGLVNRYRGRSVLDSYRQLQKLNCDTTISREREDHFKNTQTVQIG